MIRARVLALALAGAVAAAPMAQAMSLPPDAATTLETGRPWISVTLDPDGEAALINAAIDIPAPPERVWRTMTDCEATRKMIKSLVRCRVTQAGDDWDVREHVTSGGPLWPSFHYLFRSDYQARRSIRFRKLDGNLKTFEGEWALAPRDGGKATRVTYRSRVSAAIFAPPILIRAGLRRDTPRVLEIMRRLAMGE